MQFHILKNNDIDKIRWDEAIKLSGNTLIYAWSVYLDHMCPGWQAIVNEDYSIVMPLTVKKKWGIKYLYQPAFTQQLGIFATHSISEEIIQELIARAKRMVSFAQINLNYNNAELHKNEIIFKKNFILKLDKSLQEITNQYSENLKRNIYSAENLQLQYLKQDDDIIEGAVKIYQHLYGHFFPYIKAPVYNALIQLCKKLAETNNVLIRTVKTNNHQLAACNLFLKDKYRLYNIAPSTTPIGKSLNAQHFLMHNLIKEFSNTNYILDFEGSNISGIESFYKKFGAINQPYGFLKWNLLPFPIRYIKK